uniref:Uncharacterized protein n=1 Tax=Tanacetum cinerariifolium TaxID=118510 RepID=A0A6L2N8H0_TANCI|nr:hypothetical protein [Tanacetum cinerariifolium]
MIVYLKTKVMVKEPNTIQLIILLQEASYDQDFNTSLELTSSDDDTKEIKLDDLLKLVKDVGIDLMDLDSPEDDEPFIVQSDEEEEEVHVEPHAGTKETSVPPPPSPKSIKIQELTNQEFLSKINEVSRAVRNLKQCVDGLEIKVSMELKEIPKKLDEFYSTVLGLIKQVVELKNLKLELPAGCLALPEQVLSIQVKFSKLEVLDALLSILNKVTKALNKFATAIASASHTTDDQSVPLAAQLAEDNGKKTLSHKETNDEESASDFEIEVRLTGSLVESSEHKHLKKFAYVNEQGETFLIIEEEIKNQKKVEQDIKADLTKKEIQLGREELIDLLGFDVVEKVCPNRIGAGWTTIYSRIQTRMENLHKTKKKLELGFSKALGKHDQIIKLNTLAKKKRKHVHD